MRFRFVIMLLALPLVWGSTALAQPKANAFSPLQDARNLIANSERVVPPTNAVNEKALGLARRALELSFDFKELKKRNSDLDSYVAHISTQVAAEFVRESQFKARQNDWNGAMTARLDALELGVKLESSVTHASFAGAYAKDIEGMAMKEVSPIVSHLDGASAQAFAARMDLIETQRLDWFVLLEKTRTWNRRHAEEYLQKPDWKKRIVQESMVEHDGMYYGGVTPNDVKDVSPATLQKEVEQLWDFFLLNARRPPGATRSALGFKPHEAASFLFLPPDPIWQEVYLKARAQTLLLNCALKLHAVHEKTGVYPPTFDTPVDPFGSGRPMIYRRTETSYQLYSVGPKG